MQNGEIIGYSRFNSKKGNEVMYVDVAVSPSDFDKQFGRVGWKVEQIWIPSSCFDKFNESVVGKIFDAKYEISGGRANVVDVAFK